MESKEFIRGIVKTLILKLLSQKKHMYGYEITRRVEELSNGDIKLTYGALYPILYKLEGDGLLVTTTEVVENRARKYYALTAEGKKLAKTKVSELQRFTEILKSILNDNPKPQMNIGVWPA
ncbi:MAG TPA: PadR family transcriptional regulator [Cyclobacteriaceae bacterium]|nr:PadR family transcriptional regulator [Cyclobacteriaceae bacterium]